MVVFPRPQVLNVSFPLISLLVCKYQKKKSKFYGDSLCKHNGILLWQPWMGLINWCPTILASCPKSLQKCVQDDFIDTPYFCLLPKRITGFQSGHYGDMIFYMKKSQQPWSIYLLGDYLFSKCCWRWLGYINAAFLSVTGKYNSMISNQPWPLAILAESWELFRVQ